jgi:predicted DNA-binding protein (UPF0251 family)
MARPLKTRQVSFMIGTSFFRPVGVPLRCLEEVRLSVEEAETIRLKDRDGLEQEQCALKMNISRPTFQRILVSARRKIADALLNGKAVRIEGGHFEMSPGRFRCALGHEWEVPFESMVKTPPEFCPACNTPYIGQLSPRQIDCPFKRQSECCRHCSRIANFTDVSKGDMT